MQRWFPVPFGALALLLALPAPAPAVDIQVTVLGDAPDGNLADDICDADTGDVLPQCTLRAAVQTANGLPGADTILLRQATHVLTVTGAGEDDAATGDLDVIDDLTIAGRGYKRSFIDGRRVKDRILDVQPGASLTLTGASLLLGKTAKEDFDPSPPGEVSGGCLRSAGASTLDEVFLFRCASSDDGGCMSVLSGGSATVTDSIFASCRAKNEGGALEVAALGSATLTRVTAGDCRAGTGGGIAARGALTLGHATVSINKAKLGGGVAVLGDASATIGNSTIAANGGSNLLSQTTGAVTVSSSIVADTKTDCVGPVASGGGNLESATSCAFTGTDDQQSEDPLLVPLAINGGLIPTHALAETSPAIDHGVDVGDVCLTRDAIDRLRVDIADAGPAITDAGALEFEGVPNLPFFVSTPDTTAVVGEAYTHEVDTNPGNPGRSNCRTYSLTAAPTGMTIDGATGVISWTPTADQVTSPTVPPQAVTVRVADTVGSTATQSFNVTVTLLPPSP